MFQVLWPRISWKSETRGSCPLSGLLALGKHTHHCPCELRNNIFPGPGDYVQTSAELRNTRYKRHIKVTR